MKKFRLFLLVYLALEMLGGYVGLMDGSASYAFAQTAPTTTTTSVAVGLGDTFITLASVTNVNAPNFPVSGTCTTQLLIDKEAMCVTSVNTTTKVVGVTRGQRYTKATAHISGATVTLGPPNQFLQNDPVGACTSSNLLFLPIISVATGNQFNCDSTTGVWVQVATPVAFMFADRGDFIGEANCTGATTGTAGSGNATDILAGSGGARVFRVSATNAASSANTITCTFSIPSYRITANKGCLLTDITLVVSPQTTIPTSITLPTLKTFSVPAAAASETANSATFVTAGGTLTILPTSANFAALSAVNAGQFYSIKTTLGTPIFVNTDLQMFQYTIVFNQSASAASLQEVPGLFAHCTNYPL